MYTQTYSHITGSFPAQSIMSKQHTYVYTHIFTHNRIISCSKYHVKTAYICIHTHIHTEQNYTPAQGIISKQHMYAYIQTHIFTRKKNILLLEVSSQSNTCMYIYRHSHIFTHNRIILLLEVSSQSTKGHNVTTAQDSSSLSLSAPSALGEQALYGGTPCNLPKHVANMIQVCMCVYTFIYVCVYFLHGCNVHIAHTSCQYDTGLSLC